MRVAGVEKMDFIPIILCCASTWAYTATPQLDTQTGSHHSQPDRQSCAPALLPDDTLAPTNSTGSSPLASGSTQSPFNFPQPALEMDHIQPAKYADARSCRYRQWREEHIQ